MRAEIWFYEADPAESDPVLIKSLWDIPKASRPNHPDDWECGDLVAGDCTLAEHWQTIAEHIGIALAKISEV